MNQNHIGKTCPYCQFPLKAESEVVECRACKVPHHRECWAENGGCTTFGCHEKSYQPAVATDRLEISFDELTCRGFPPARGRKVNRLLIAALVITLLTFTGMVFAYINLLSDRAAVADDLNASGLSESESDPGEVAENPVQTYDPAVIAALDADYYIDYENGTIPIGELPIGTRVVDPSWEWEFRIDHNYSNKDWRTTELAEVRGEIKPVTWIVVDKDYYNIDELHVTLLSEELIGFFAFDDSTDRGHFEDEYGHNHWGKSGTTNATHGIRPWLNSNGIHSGEGLYHALSADFKQVLLSTPVSNKSWSTGDEYITSDNVFITSSSELSPNSDECFSYFLGAEGEMRSAKLDDDYYLYWTRSPSSLQEVQIEGKKYSLGGQSLWYIGKDGLFYALTNANNCFGVRPVLNLSADVLVTKIK